jgi:CheY-like chemotaxis protein
MITKPARIVLAEDDKTIARLIEIALKRTGIPHDLEVAHDGHQAIRALSRSAPDLCLLDLYMPGKDGFEVLEHIRRQEALRRIPVVMFSASPTPSDVNRAYDLHVNAYVIKQTDFAEMCRTLDSVVHFWLRTATPPSNLCS